jgi:hypothetical protein
MKYNVNTGSGRKLDRELIPNVLQEIVPLVEKWAFSSMDDQDEFIELMSSEFPDELEAFNQEIDRISSAIREWGRDLGFIDPRTSPDHPYFAFLDVLKLRETSGPSTDPEEIEKINNMKARLAAEHRHEHYSEASKEADDAFRKGDFLKYVEILSSYEDLLSDVQQKKISIARKRSN